MRPQTRAAIDAISEGITAYRNALGPTVDNDLRVRQDLATFHLIATERGLAGLAFQFGDCLFCPIDEAAVGCRLMMCCYPGVTTPRNGRALVGVVCHDHDAYFSDTHNLAGDLFRGGFRNTAALPPQFAKEKGATHAIEGN